MGASESNLIDPTVSSRGVALSVIPVTQFGKYTLIAKLGQGGMAEVFLAFIMGPAGFKKLVVVKRLHPHLEEEPGFLDMFMDEARLAARLNHPNVVQTYEVGEVDGSHFIAMEYLDGQGFDRLQRRCARTKTALPVDLTARIVCDALEGLHHAHELKDFDGSKLGVVHRDVSPQNVFITYDGTVKLLDFGIAKAATHVVETRTGVVKGKFAYIAPEQARGGGIDRRADIWSMGVVLWEALAGRRLFKSANELATLTEALTAPIPSLVDAAPGVPEDLSKIADKALQRDPEKRYQTAVQMKDDLDRWLVSQSKAATRSDLGQFLTGLFSDVIDQHRRLLELSVDGASLRSVSGTFPAEATPSRVRPMPSGFAPAEPAKSSMGPKLVVLGAAVLLAIIAALAIPRFFGSEQPRVASVAPEGPAAGTQRTAEPPAAGNNPGGSGGPATAPGQPPSAEPGQPAAGTAAGPSGAGAGSSATGATAGGPTAAVGGTEPPSAAQQPAAPEQPSGPNPPMTARERRRLELQRERERERDRSRDRDRRQGQPVATPTPAPTPAPAPEPRPAQQQPEPVEEYGFLTLDTVPWSQVSTGGRSLGTTPLIRVRLPAGSHVLTLRNPERGISTTYRVRILPGQTFSRRLGLE